MTLFVEYFMEGMMHDGEIDLWYQRFKDTEQNEIMKEKLAQYFKWKLDGSRFYIGRSMVEVHSNLGISDETFDKMLGILTVSLKKMKPNINIKILREFVKRIAAIRPQICFPPVIAQYNGQPSQIEANFISPGGPDEDEQNKDESTGDKDTTLFNQLG